MTVETEQSTKVATCFKLVHITEKVHVNFYANMPVKLFDYINTTVKRKNNTLLIISVSTTIWRLYANSVLHYDIS